MCIRDRVHGVLVWGWKGGDVGYDLVKLCLCEVCCVGVVGDKLEEVGGVLGDGTGEGVKGVRDVNEGECGGLFEGL
eukprot:11530983-Alexandrium_andersonii.AAC.1